MNKSLNYFSVIRSIIPYAYNITRPCVPGTLHSVYIVESADGTFVCKFNHRELAVKNAAVANTMRMHTIAVPDIRVHNHGTHWIEVYPIITGQTLYEHIGAGLADEQIRRVYHDVVDAFAKMDDIDPVVLGNMKYKNTHRVAKTNMSDTNNVVMGTLFSGAVRMMNHGGNVGVYHCGMTQKNIILDNAGNFKALIDLDEVAIADKNYAFAMMAAKYQNLGYDIMELVDYYESQTGRELNRKKIRTIADLTNVGKHILWFTGRRGNTR